MIPPEQTGMDYLKPAERSQLQKARFAEPSIDETIRQLDRILASRTFARVQRRAKDFLGFVVAKKLLGHTDRVKEMTIAICVFHESAEFDPLESSKVRVAASDLRRRIAAYYANEGQQDSIEIIIPTNTYVPEIRNRCCLLLIRDFENWHPQADQDHLCTTIRDELAHQLGRVGWIRVTTVAAFESRGGARRYGLRGSFEYKENVLRLNLSLADLSARRIVYWRSFQGRRNEVFDLTRSIAVTFFKALRTAVPRPLNFEQSQPRTPHNLPWAANDAASKRTISGRVARGECYPSHSIRCVRPA
jgi:TolB-like protein